MPRVPGRHLLAAGVAAALVAASSPAVARPATRADHVGPPAPVAEAVPGSLVVTFDERDLHPDDLHPDGLHPLEPAAPHVAHHAAAVDATRDAARAAAASVGGVVERASDGIAKIVVAPGAESSAAAALLTRGDVVAVERDSRVRAAYVPSDLLWPHAIGLVGHHVDDLWDVTTGTPEIVIAIVDSGVTETADLQGRLVGGYDAVDGDASAEDLQGHGTKSAHVAAATIDNGVGAAGACPRCSVMPIRVLDDTGSGTEFDMVDGVRWAVANGADVVNLSLGGSYSSEFARQAFADARAAGVVVVAAAGNAASTLPKYPAAYPDVLSVGAVDAAMCGRAAYSSYGPSVDVAASGTNVAGGPDGGFSLFTGTSSAAPVVAGVAGLLLSGDPTLSPAQVSAALTSTSTDVEWVTHGVVDAAAAYTAAVGAPVPGASVTGAGCRRLAGANRYATAAAISAAIFEPGVRRVYVATGASYPDGLSAAAAAAAAGGPVLLSAAEAVPDATLAELARLDPAEIVLVGGTQVLAEAARTRLATVAPARRVAGADRYDTAARVAVDTFDTSATVYLASGATFADALPGGPAAATRGAPILLATPTSLPEVTAAAIRQLEAREVVVLGGPAAVRSTVLEQVRALGVEARRVAGDTRYETAARVATDAFAGGADVVLLASGTGFADALGGGAAAAAVGAPLLTVQLDQLPAETAAALRELGTAQVLVLGGPAAVGDGVLAQLADLRS